MQQRKQAFLKLWAISLRYRFWRCIIVLFNLSLRFLLCCHWSSYSESHFVHRVSQSQVSIFCFLPSVQAAGSEEGEVTRCGSVAAGKGELWVLWTGQDASAARRHHQPAGQGVHHPAHHQLPEDEGLRQPGRPTVESAHGRTTAQHLRQR